MESAAQFLLEPQPDVRGVPVAGKIDEGGHEAAVDVGAQEQAGATAFLKPKYAQRRRYEVLYVDLEQFVARVGFENGQEVLPGV